MIVLRALGYLWALPHSLVGILFLLYYRPESVKWRDGCLEGVGVDNLLGGPWVGAQTYGWVVYYRDDMQFRRGDLRVHERVHVTQSLIGGVFFPLAYGLHFLWLWGFGLRQSWRDAYYKIYFESVAYAKDANYDAARLRGEDVSGYWGHKDD